MSKTAHNQSVRYNAYNPYNLKAKGILSVITHRKLFFHVSPLFSQTIFLFMNLAKDILILESNTDTTHKKTAYSKTSSHIEITIDRNSYWTQFDQESKSLHINKTYLKYLFIFSSVIVVSHSLSSLYLYLTK